MARTTILRRRLTVLAIAGVFVVALVILRSGGEDGHVIVARTAEATNVVRGQSVREGGAVIGSVKDIRSVPFGTGRGAEITFEIDDEAWPLPSSSALVLRWGGTVRFSDRYFALRRGAASEPTLAEGAQLPPRQLVAPVEFDQFLNVFDAKARRGLRSLINRGGDALSLSGRPLRRAVTRSPEALEQAVGLLRDLDENRLALRSLVRSGSRVVGAVHRARPDVDALLSGATTTLRALADEQAGLRRSIAQAPETFTNLRTTLAAADPTLRRTGRLLDGLGPGVADAQRLVPTLNRLLASVTKVAPEAARTLDVGADVAKVANPFVDEATARMPQLESIFRQADKELECVRPYTPEIAAFAATWSGFLSGFDGTDRYARVNPQVLPFAPVNTMTYGSGTAKKLFPDLRYAFPRPPGTTAGQPWLLPGCEAGKDALDPFKDPEDRTRGNG